MLKSSRLSCVWTVLLCLLGAFAGSTAQGQTQTPLDRQLSRIDLGVSGVGEFTRDVSGTNYLGVPLTQSAANTLGALVTVRYTKSPYVGLELNYGYARYTQHYTTNGADAYLIGGVQANASEYTFGYVAHPRRQFFGLQPYLGGGLGAIMFKPTSGGGQGLQRQPAAVYYYNLGVEKPITEHFGVRAHFRQLFYLAPDFYQNYLTIEKHTSTIEPGAGFYLRF
ncbi:MAG TPA: outer membrane beta-barrel protein [Edaphobacter sp.]|nr:outer membrane beta-barrel protein [Edaphobacter sp.]